MKQPRLALRRNRTRKLALLVIALSVALSACAAAVAPIPPSTQQPVSVPTALPTAASAPTALPSATSVVVEPTKPAEPTAEPMPSLLTPVADAFVDRDEPDTNFGNRPRIETEDDPLLRSFLRFEVSGLAQGSVARAQLRLFVANGSDDKPVDLSIFSTVAEWDEEAITWNNQPLLRALVAEVAPAPLAPDQWLEIDLGPIITRNGAYSFALISTSSGRLGFNSNARSNAPELVLTLEAQGAPAATTIAAATAFPVASATPLVSVKDEIFVGAGDIANCSKGSELTTQLLDTIEGTVFTTGDNAYPDGTAEDFRRCYEPTWGRHKARTRPSPGNHDYHTDDAAAYYDYFGENAGPDKRGYYSYNLGAWHIISLNSEIDADGDSPQARWLRQDLADNPAACTLAYWHTAVFSSGAQHGNSNRMRRIWDILAAARADVIVVGHEHTYERFAPQTSSGQASPNGIRQFVVGTGGAGHYAFAEPLPNSEARSTGVSGVLKLTLRATSYDWEFVPVERGAFRDSGSASCVMSEAAP